MTVNSKAISCLVATAIATSTLIAVSASTSLELRETQSSTDPRLICTELGLTPDAMAALGVVGSQVNGIFGELDERDSAITSLRSIQTQHQEAFLTLKNAQKAIRHAEDVAAENLIQLQINQAESDIANLAQSIKQAQTQLRQAVLPSGISPQLIQSVCAPTGMAAWIPVEYRTAELSDEDCTELLAALAAERRANANNEQVDSEIQAILNQYRNRPDVLQARTNMLYHLDAVRGAFTE